MALSVKLPDKASLHEAALTYLARYPTTRARLERVLLRRIARWQRAATGEPEAIAAIVAHARTEAHTVVERLAAAGAVDDAAFAAARARRLARGGKSRRAIAAHLLARGIEEETLAATLPADPSAELLAALAFVKRRRFGPFRPVPPDTETMERELAALGRAGFPARLARQALRMPRAEAEERLAAIRRTLA